MSDQDDEYLPDRQARKERKGRPSNADTNYAWEAEYNRSWDVVQEDAAGSLAGVVEGLVQAGKRKRLLKNTTPVQRGIIRHLVLVVDMSSAMLEKDLRPTRQDLTLQYASEFVVEYFEQNPISQIGIVTTRDGLAFKATDLSGNPQDHVSALQALRKQEAMGSPSLQNVLEMARASLYHVPSHGTREVLIIYGALLSADPGDIHKTITSLVADKIRVQIIGLAAQVAVCQDICKATNSGDESSYGVILNEGHFRELLMDKTTPPADKVTKRSDATLVRMGFPSRIAEIFSSLCVCHSSLSKGGFVCPRCGSKVCVLPIECFTCGLTLVLSTHLARSYHHLFPLRNWSEVPHEVPDLCYSCRKPFPMEVPQQAPMMNGGSTTNSDRIHAISPIVMSSRYSCPECKNHFCIDCDLFAHEVLHNCPGCECG